MICAKRTNKPNFVSRKILTDHGMAIIYLGCLLRGELELPTHPPKEDLLGIAPGRVYLAP